MQKKVKLWVKFLFVGASLLLVGLFTLGVVQTFKLKNLQNQTRIMQSKVDKSVEENQAVQNEIDFKESQEYAEESCHADEKVKDGEVIYK